MVITASKVMTMKRILLTIALAASLLAANSEARELHLRVAFDTKPLHDFKFEAVVTNYLRKIPNVMVDNVWENEDAVLLIDYFYHDGIYFYSIIGHDVYRSREFLKAHGLNREEAVKAGVGATIGYSAQGMSTPNVLRSNVEQAISSADSDFIRRVVGEVNLVEEEGEKSLSVN